MKPAECLVIKESVFALDERIRYFGFLDNRQGMVVSEFRRNEAGGQPEQQLVRDLTFFKGAMSSWALYFGHVDYSLVVHDTVKIVMVPVESGLVVVTTEPEYPVEGVQRVSEIVKDRVSSLGKI